MDDLSLQKVAISGPTLASMIQRISTSHGDVDGLLFGHFTQPNISSLTDDDPSTTASVSSASLIATITSFITTTSTCSFYDSTGKIDPIVLRRFLPSSTLTLIGWFSGRRNTSLRPSLREFSVSHCFSRSQLSFPVQNSTLTSPPSLFLLFTTPLSDQFIHTHDYRAYQFCTTSNSLEHKSIEIVNIGPAFRGHYGSFSPNSQFPLLHCDERASIMLEDRDEVSLMEMRRTAYDQAQLNKCAEGFQIGALNRMTLDSVNYTAGLEELYEKMLAKLDNLAMLVEKSSANVLEQENNNMKLRYKMAGLD